MNAGCLNFRQILCHHGFRGSFRFHLDRPEMIRLTHMELLFLKTFLVGREFPVEEKWRINASVSHNK